MMGAATAMLVGGASSKAVSTATGDASTEQEGTDFLAALDAAVPADPVATGCTPAVPQQAEDAPTEDAVVVDMAAVLAAMLQTVVPAAGTGENAEPDAGDAAPAGDASLLPAGTTKAIELANLRAAAATLATATTETDPTAENPLAGQAIAATANPLDSKIMKSGTQAGLRELMQMLAPQASAAAAGTTDNQSADRAAQAPATYMAPAELLRRVVDQVATSVAAGVKSPEPTASPTPEQPALADNGLASANLLAPAHQARPASTVPEQTLQAPVGTPRWADELGSRLALMTLRGQHEGSLNLTPEHLGPLEVRISVSQNTANVWFGSQHADTRAALAEALPRLRELMAGAGLNLGQTGVSHEAPRQGSRESEAARINAARTSAPVEGLDVVTTPAARRIALGLVDTYV